MATKQSPLTYNGENGFSTFSQSFLTGSSSNSQTSRTGIKSLRSSNSRWIWPTSHIFIICPWFFIKAIVDTVQGIVLSFVIRSLWNLQITWAGIKPHPSSKFGQSGISALKLPSLDLWKRPYLTFWACWILVSDRFSKGNLFWFFMALYKQIHSTHPCFHSP